MMLLAACHFDGHRPQPGADNSWAKAYCAEGADLINPKPIAIGTASKTAVPIAIGLEAIPIETGFDSPNRAKGYYT